MAAHKTGFFRARILARGLLLVGLTSGGCGLPPFTDVLVGPNGEQIRSAAIQNIVDNPDLTEEEQRQALRDLGITDEGLIDLFLRDL